MESDYFLSDVSGITTFKGIIIANNSPSMIPGLSESSKTYKLLTTQGLIFTLSNKSDWPKRYKDMLNTTVSIKGNLNSYQIITPIEINRIANKHRNPSNGLTDKILDFFHLNSDKNQENKNK